jgi:hypothetical protein
MKMNIEVLFVIILLIFNLGVGGFLIFLLASIDSPGIYAEITISGLSSDEIELDTKLDVSNSNPFDVYVKNIKVISKTGDGIEFTRFSFNGGEVPSNNEKTFTAKKNVSLNGDVPRVLKNIITADVGVRFLGVIEKNIPVEALVVVSVEELLDELAIPDIIIHAGIKEINEKGLVFNADIDISNPNDIELSVNDIVVYLKTEKDVSVGTMHLQGGTLKPQDNITLNAIGNLSFEALDAESISIDLVGEASANVAGITQSLTLTASAILDVPDLSELFSLEDSSFGFSIAGEFKFRLKGIITTIRFKVFNPSNLPLEAKNLVCSISGVTGDDKKIVVEKEMQACKIASKNEVCISTNLTIPYIKLLTSGTGRLLPDWLSVQIKGGFSIDGTNQSIPISINGFLDPHILT